MAECSVCYKPNSTLRCPTCKAVYCSVEHQKMVWYVHKHACWKEPFDYVRQPNLTDCELAFIRIVQAQGTGGLKVKFGDEPFEEEEFNMYKTLSVRGMDTLPDDARNWMLTSIRLNSKKHDQLVKETNKLPYLNVFQHLAYIINMAGCLKEGSITTSLITNQMIPLFFTLLSVTYSAHNHRNNKDTLDQANKNLTIIIEKIRKVMEPFKSSDPEGFKAWELAMGFEQMGIMYCGLEARVSLGLATIATVKPLMDNLIDSGWVRV